MGEWLLNAFGLIAAHSSLYYILQWKLALDLLESAPGGSCHEVLLEVCGDARRSYNERAWF